MSPGTAFIGYSSIQLLLNSTLYFFRFSSDAIFLLRSILVCFKFSKWRRYCEECSGVPGSQSGRPLRSICCYLSAAELKGYVFIVVDMKKWTEDKEQFPVRNSNLTVRPGDRNKNRETHGKTVRLGRSALAEPKPKCFDYLSASLSLYYQIKFSQAKAAVKKISGEYFQSELISTPVFAFFLNHTKIKRTLVQSSPFNGLKISPRSFQ